MKKIKRKTDTEDSRKFWKSFPVQLDNENLELPPLGEWRDTEKDLSPCLLTIDE